VRTHRPLWEIVALIFLFAVVAQVIVAEVAHLVPYIVVGLILAGAGGIAYRRMRRW